VLHFVFAGLARFAHWWVVLEAEKRELCVDNPGKPVDLTIATNVRTWAEIWAGDTSLSQAKAEGRLELQGTPVLAKTISAWLRAGVFAEIRPANWTAAR
jgi:putative sterol carrier protein